MQASSGHLKVQILVRSCWARKGTGTLPSSPFNRPASAGVSAESGRFSSAPSASSTSLLEASARRMLAASAQILNHVWALHGSPTPEKKAWFRSALLLLDAWPVLGAFAKDPRSIQFPMSSRFAPNTSSISRMSRASLSCQNETLNFEPFLNTCDHAPKLLQPTERL